MRCCVPGCKNDSRHISKSEGITFHVFPSEPTLQASWLRAVGKETWKPQKRSAVCSEHFLCDDLYETKNGMRKVRAGAVPLVLQDSGNCDYGEPASLKVCRICLATDHKLYPIRKYKLDQAYEQLTGFTVSAEDKLPQKLCYECAQRLVNCSRFRTKSLRALNLMLELVKKQEHLTIQNLKSINRTNNQLTSILTPKYFKTDHYDYIIEEQTTKNEINISSANNEVFIEEFDSIIDTEDNQNGIDYSSDDSLPLGVSKRKKEKIKQSSKRVRKKSSKETENGEDMKCVECGKNFVDQEEYFSHMATHNDFLNENQMANETNNFDIGDAEIKTSKETQEINSNADEKVKYEFEVKIEDQMDEEYVASERDYTSDDSTEVKKRKKESKKVKKTQKKSSEPKIDRRRKPFLSDDLNETLFNITDLSFEEQVADIEKRQESSNYKNAVFKCTECFKGFLDQDAYNSHMLRHTEECGEHRCAVCKTHFKHPHALRKHITAHHTQRFSCKQCPYVTAHRQSARLHERWHKGTKYSCPHCPDEFLKFTTYMGHIRIKHPSDFVCQLCGYSFVSEKGIALHKKLKHRQENMPIPEDGPHCELCNIRFIDSEALKKHISVSARHNSVDKDSRVPNKPTYTAKKDNREREKRARERREREDDSMYPSQLRKAEGPIPCEQCGLQLEDSRAYHGHFRRMHPDKNRTNYPSMKSPCMCEVCGRMFQSYALLKDHRWTHTGERPFKCEACGKAFRMKQRLVAHRRVHSAPRAAYACAACGKHFSTHSNRQRHMFIHTGLKPFKCEMCGKGFKHASEKRAHITYVHLKKPWPKRSRGKRRDSRQAPMQPPTDMPTPDMGMQPIWPACDPKMAHMQEKPPYYAVKM